MQMPIPNRRILDKQFISQVAAEPVKEFAISAGARHGDNMMGKLLALDVKTQSNDIINLVIKSVLPMSGVIDKNTLSQSKFIAGLGKFPNETCYYTKIRPIFEEIINKRKSNILTNRISLFTSPKYISSHSGGSPGLNDYIALEDLRPWGYKMSNKFKGMTVKEVDAVLKELALIHATSFSLLQSGHVQFCELQADSNCLLNSHIWERLTSDQLEQPFFNMIIAKVVEILIENGDSETARKIEPFAKEGQTILLDLSKRTHEIGKYFRVFIHGDLWTNNILFKYAYDGKTVEDVKFVDYQDCRFGNIYEDLHYFIFTSTTTEFRANHLRSCLKNYFQEFANLAAEFDCALPKEFSEEQLIATFYEHIKYGFCYNLVAIPFQLGMQPPPPSPMTPIDLEVANKSDNAFFPLKLKGSDSSSNTVQQPATSGEPTPEDNFLGSIGSLAESLKVGVRNSPTAQKRLKEIINEMLEMGVL